MNATATHRPPGVEPDIPWPHETAPELGARFDQAITAPPAGYERPRRWLALLYAWIFQRTAAAVYLRQLEHLEGLALEYRRALGLADEIAIYAKASEFQLDDAIRRTRHSQIEPRAEMTDAARWHRREDYAHRRVQMAISDIVIALERRPGR